MMLGSTEASTLVRSIRRGVLLGLAAMALVAASAAVSVARTPSEESASAAQASATPAMVVPVALVRRGVTAIPDEAAMVLAGAALFGVAAAVKRAA